MKELSAGKIRGLQQISTSNGLFIICALDHRGSLKTMMEKGRGVSVSYDDIVEFKMELCEIVMPFASGILLDPLYGAAQGIATSTLPGNKGLLVSVENTGYENNSEGRITTLLEDWGVEKIKRMGASAVKMLLYYRPDLVETAKIQLATVKKVADECVKYDIPFLLEPVTYPVEVHGTPEYFSEKKTDLVVRTAKQVTEMAVDVLKAEFPADMIHKQSDKRLMEKCQKLDDASQVPWVILSAGVDYDVFLRQVELACKAGASGFLGGRVGLRGDQDIAGIRPGGG